MFQSLSNHLFAVPFLAALAGGVAGVALGLGTFWWLRRQADRTDDRRVAYAGGGGLIAGGLALVAFAFRQAGLYARLVARAGTADGVSALGRVGLALPWGTAAAALGVLALAGVVSAAVFEVAGG